MCTDINKKLFSRDSNSVVLVFALFMFLSPTPLYAWLNAPVDLSQDITGSEVEGDCAGSISDGVTTQICHKVVLNPGSESEFSLDRCDTKAGIYNPPVSNTCHRWGLIWSDSGAATDSWPSYAVQDQRLPTLKELTKLVLNDDLESSIIGAWLDSVGSDVWFISSSYAKVRGTCGNHIFGVNASTGETGRFKLIDVEVDDGAGGTTTETQWRMLEGTMLDSCNYAEGEPSVHALVVNKSTVKELM